MNNHFPNYYFFFYRLLNNDTLIKPSFIYKYKNFQNIYKASMFNNTWQNALVAYINSTFKIDNKICLKLSLSSTYYCLKTISTTCCWANLPNIKIYGQLTGTNSTKFAI